MSNQGCVHARKAVYHLGCSFNTVALRLGVCLLCFCFSMFVVIILEMVILSRSLRTLLIIVLFKGTHLEWLCCPQLVHGAVSVQKHGSAIGID